MVIANAVYDIFSSHKPMHDQTYAINNQIRNDKTQVKKTEPKRYMFISECKKKGMKPATVTSAEITNGLWKTYSKYKINRIFYLLKEIRLNITHNFLIYIYICIYV